MIRAVIFDFDGLILDTETPEWQAWHEVYQQYGCELSLDRWVASIGLGWGSSDPYHELETLVGHPLDRDAIRQSRRARQHALLLECPVLPGVVAYLRAAARMGLQVGIASSSPRTWIVPHLQRLGLAASFPYISCADDVQRTKPDPQVYQVSLALLGVLPEEAIALEDSPNGVAAATAAGIYCVAVPNPLTRHLPFAEADLCIASLADMSLSALVRQAEAC